MRIHTQLRYEDINVDFQLTFCVVLWTTTAPDRSSVLKFVEHELPGLLHEDVPLATRNSMWFMHDGAPAHFSHVAREYLDVACPNRWMGRAGPVP